jgi:hypothetical protein
MLALVLAALVAFPSTSRTSWMRPESFHLAIGMPRAEALRKLDEAHWKTRPGKDANQLVVDYTDASSLTLEFRKNRLHAVRFELFAFLQDARAAFGEEKEYLAAAFGPPKKLKTDSILLYDHVLPNVMAVLTADPKSENGRKGLGVVVVRYYDPAS